jgi:hypothetical protein
MNLISVEDFKENAIEIYRESLVPLANLYSYQNLPEYENLKRQPTIVFIGQDSVQSRELIEDILEFKINSQMKEQEAKDISIYLSNGCWEKKIKVSQELNYKFHDEINPSLNENVYTRRELEKYITYYPVDSPLVEQVEVVDLSKICEAFFAGRVTDEQKKIKEYYLKNCEAVFVVSQTDDKNVEKVCEKLVNFMNLNEYPGSLYLVLNHLEYADKLSSFINFFASYCFSYGKLLGKNSKAEIIVYHSTKMALKTNYDLSELTLKSKEVLYGSLASVASCWSSNIKREFSYATDRLKVLDMALMKFRKIKLSYTLRSGMLGMFLIFISSLLLGFYALGESFFKGYTDIEIALWFSLFFVFSYILWHAIVVYFFFLRKRRNILRNLQQLYEISSSNDLSLWMEMEPLIRDNIQNNNKFLKTKTEEYLHKLNKFNM